MANLEFRIIGVRKNARAHEDRSEQRPRKSRAPRRFSAGTPVLTAPVVWTALIVAGVYASDLSGAAPLPPPASYAVVQMPNLPWWKPRVKGIPNCDCGKIEAGGGGIVGALGGIFGGDGAACSDTQSRLQQLANDNKLVLQADTDGNLVSGEFCSGGGPDAWPVQGGPARPSKILP